MSGSRVTTARSGLARRWVACLGVCAPALGALVATSAAAERVTAKLAPWKLPAQVYRTVAVVSHGHIFVLGGHDSAGGTITRVYRFDPQTGRTAVAGALALATHGSAAAVVKGRILVFGGASLVVHDTVQWFNPATRTSTVVGHLPVVLADTTAATAGGETVLIGGFNGVGPQTAVWGTVNGTSFHVVAQLVQPVRYPAVAAEGHYVYVFGGLLYGGEYNGVFTDDIQRLDLATGKVTVMAYLPVALAHAMATEMGGHLFLMGGSSSSSTSARIFEFNPANGALTPVAQLPRPVTDAAVATIGHATYLLGGISPSGPLQSITVVGLRS